MSIYYHLMHVQYICSTPSPISAWSQLSCCCCLTYPYLFYVDLIMLYIIHNFCFCYEFYVMHCYVYICCHVMNLMSYFYCYHMYVCSFPGPHFHQPVAEGVTIVNNNNNNTNSQLLSHLLPAPPEEVPLSPPPSLVPSHPFQLDLSSHAPPLPHHPHLQEEANHLSKTLAVLLDSGNVLLQLLHGHTLPSPCPFFRTIGRLFRQLLLGRDP